MKKPAPRHGLSLERFAHAKTSSYDKKKAKEKEFALNAKKVNKYRKLKQRLAKAGKLRPLTNTLEQVLEDEKRPAQKASKSMEGDSSPHSRAKGGIAGLELDRIVARAGPVPDEDSDDFHDVEMVGDKSDESDEEPAPAGRAQERVHPAMSSGRQMPGPQDKRANSTGGRGRGPVDATDKQGVQEEHLHPNLLHQPAGATVEPPSGSQANGSERARKNRTETNSHEGKHRRSKPPSRMQRIAAEVQARKDAEAKVREARKADLEAHKLRVAEVEKQRKQQTKLLRKRTRLGQPVMRYRMDKLLGQLQAESQGS
ncbi:g2015 [Coccomyxa elongata]